MAAPGWYPDPHGRFDHRYFDGEAWTDQVATAGVASVDPASVGPAPEVPPGGEQVTPAGDGAAELAPDGGDVAPAVPRDLVARTVLKYRWRVPLRGLVFADTGPDSWTALREAVDQYRALWTDAEEPLAFLAGLLFSDQALYLAIPGQILRFPLSELESVEWEDKRVLGHHTSMLHLTAAGGAFATIPWSPPNWLVAGLVDGNQAAPPAAVDRGYRLLHELLWDLIGLWHPVAGGRRPPTEAWFHEEDLARIATTDPQVAAGRMAIRARFPDCCIVCLAPSQVIEPAEVMSNRVEVHSALTWVATGGVWWTKHRYVHAVLHPGVPYCAQHRRPTEAEPGRSPRAHRSALRHWDPHLRTEALAVWDVDAKRPVVKTVGLHFDDAEYTRRFCAENGLLAG